MSDEQQPIDESQLGWFDRSSSKRLLWRILWCVCILSFIAEFFVHRHPHWSFDKWKGYYGAFGFVSCAGAIGVAKLLGIWLKVKEDYYDE